MNTNKMSVIVLPNLGVIIFNFQAAYLSFLPINVFTNICKCMIIYSLLETDYVGIIVEGVFF